MVAPFTAEIVTVSPVTPPVAENVGVVSVVLLSEVEEPESDAVARSGAAGADGEVASIFTDNAELDVEVFPAGSVTVALTDHVPSVSVGKSQEVAVPTT